MSTRINLGFEMRDECGHSRKLLNHHNVLSLTESVHRLMTFFYSYNRLSTAEGSAIPLS